MATYYNEHDPFAAQWLRELIKANLIAPGEVDERDIQQVGADDLRGFAQCHFFAGIGVWSYSLRLAGWPDDRECWTGSCPCPSFSPAGEGKGFNDARHLWPYWIRLIRERKPATILGEQVDSAIGYGWLDLVQTDLEAEAYAVGKVVLGSRIAGFDDERLRLYFVADSSSERRERPFKDNGLPFAAKAALPEHGDNRTFGRHPLDTHIGCVPLRNGTTVSLERGLLRGYGNALNAQVAKAFIEAAIECGIG